MELSVHTECWRLGRPFRIAGREQRTAIALVVELSDGGFTGRGEAQGVPYFGETANTMLVQIDAIAADVCGGASRDDLLELLPAGGARNAIDCALWDLEAKRTGRTIWELTGISPHPVKTVLTIGIEHSPEAMAEKAEAAGHSPLKIKLDGDRPIERLVAIRRACPDAELVADANQSWTFELLREVLPACAGLEIGMIEQPLPRGADHVLDGFESSVLLAADESCQDGRDLGLVAGRYGMINIKLDKTGGLTEALKLARAARKQGLKLMVGNMLGTSVAMAPSFVLAQLCDLVDIDGPLLLKHDRPNALVYEAGIVHTFEPRLWG